MLLLCLFTLSASVNLGFDINGDGVGYMPYILSMLGLECCGLFYILLNYKKIVFRKFVFIVFFWICLMSFTQIFSGRFVTNIPQVLLWPICFLTCYLFVRSNSRYFYRLVNWFIVCFIIGFVVFLFVSVARSKLLVGNALAGTNNIFYPLLVLPWILIQRRGFLRNVLLLVLLFAVILSTKRSAMLIVFFTLLPYLYYCFMKNSNISLQKRIIAPFMLSFLFVIIFIGINNSVDGYIWKRFESIEEDKGSGRLDIYAQVYDMQMRSEIEEWLVGHGHQGVVRDYDGSWGEFSAHNDFQEVLYDYGIFVFLLYLYLFGLLSRRLYRLKRSKSIFFVSYFGAMILFCIMSAMSHLILYSTYFIFLTSYWGAVEGMLDNQRKRNYYLC